METIELVVKKYKPQDELRLYERNKMYIERFGKDDIFQWVKKRYENNDQLKEGNYANPEYEQDEFTDYFVELTNDQYMIKFMRELEDSDIDPYLTPEDDQIKIFGNTIKDRVKKIITANVVHPLLYAGDGIIDRTKPVQHRSFRHKSAADLTLDDRLALMIQHTDSILSIEDLKEKMFIEGHFHKENEELVINRSSVGGKEFQRETNSVYFNRIKRLGYLDGGISIDEITRLSGMTKKEAQKKKVIPKIIMNWNNINLN